MSGSYGTEHLTVFFNCSLGNFHQPLRLGGIQFSSDLVQQFCSSSDVTGLIAGWLLLLRLVFRGVAASPAASRSCFSAGALTAVVGVVLRRRSSRDHQWPRRFSVAASDGVSTLVGVSQESENDDDGCTTEHITITENGAPAFGLSNNKMAMAGVDTSSFYKRTRRPKSNGLVQRSASAMRCSAFINRAKNAKWWSA